MEKVHSLSSNIQLEDQETPNNKCGVDNPLYRTLLPIVAYGAAGRGKKTHHQLSLQRHPIPEEAWETTRLMADNEDKGAKGNGLYGASNASQRKAGTNPNIKA